MNLLRARLKEKVKSLSLRKKYLFYSEADFNRYISSLPILNRGKLAFIKKQIPNIIKFWIKKSIFLIYLFFVFFLRLFYYLFLCFFSHAKFKQKIKSSFLGVKSFCLEIIISFSEIKYSFSKSDIDRYLSSLPILNHRKLALIKEPIPNIVKFWIKKIIFLSFVSLTVKTFQLKNIESDSNDINLLKVHIFKNIISFPGFILFYNLKKTLAFVPGRYKIEQTLLSEDFLKLVVFNKTRTHLKMNRKYLKESGKIESGINLLAGFNNYWHFLIEQAPKITIAAQLKIDNHIPILIPEDLHPNLYEIIELLNDSKRKIIKVSPNCLKQSPAYIKIKKLYDIGDHLINPYHAVNIDIESDVAINPAPIQDMVKQVFSHYQIKPKSNENVKLFLKRNSHYRVSTDQDKLQDFAVKNGFQIFEPEKHSFKEQVEICSKASMFLGFSGSGCANTIFLPKDAKKIILINKGIVVTALVKLWKKLLNNCDFIFTDFKPEYDNDIHGTPFLTKENWQDLKKLIAGGKTR